MINQVKKCWNTHKGKLVYVAIVALIGFIAYDKLDIKKQSSNGVVAINELPKNVQDVVKVDDKLDKIKPVDELKSKTLEVKEPKASEACTPTEAKLILSDELIAKQMNLFMLDLNVARYVSHDMTTSYFTKEKMFGVKRELISGAKQIYLMIYEPISDLKYNKVEYDKYILKKREFIKVEGK